MRQCVNNESESGALKKNKWQHCVKWEKLHSNTNFIYNIQYFIWSYDGLNCKNKIKFNLIKLKSVSFYHQAQKYNK